MGAVTDDAISQLDQIRIVLVSLLVLLPSMKLKWDLNLLSLINTLFLAS